MPSEFAAVTIALNPEQAGHAARALFSMLSGVVESAGHIDSADKLAELEAKIAMSRERLEQIEFGEPKTDVLFTVQRGELEGIALYLGDAQNVEQLWDTVREAREHLAAGAIMRQLEATQ
jgi:hypothetical protein